MEIYLPPCLLHKTHYVEHASYGFSTFEFPEPLSQKTPTLRHDTLPYWPAARASPPQAGGKLRSQIFLTLLCPLSLGFWS